MPNKNLASLQETVLKGELPRGQSGIVQGRAGQEQKMRKEAVGKMKQKQKRKKVVHWTEDEHSLQLTACKLNGNDYMTWSRAMMIALKARNKLGYVNGSVKRPADGDPMGFLQLAQLYIQPENPTKEEVTSVGLGAAGSWARALMGAGGLVEGTACT
ncbi:hypothetical protein CRG98_029557 [Punica granatum]|uniref:Retrotransposon Copia-like N-terminal domain-containing protein n=1 Tax=Punica granatum TaxID=22663 RepID=A0A2I0J1E5_PUNGR|nr:hypothetical protein CRG98_029557 [Punica granatum]